MIKKESRTFYMSVEGINCETLYFMHLAKLINESGSNRYNLKVNPKVASPIKQGGEHFLTPGDGY